MSQPGERQRQPQPAARPGPRLAFPSGWGWWAKLVFVAVLDALVIPFVITLFRDQQYAFFASVVVGVLLINIVALVERAYPLRYLLPGLLFMGSFVVRMGVLLGGLWVVTRGRIAETAVALVFVMVARRLVIDVVRRGAEKAPDADPGP